MINTCIKLRIADIIIEMKSKFTTEPMTSEEKRRSGIERLENFIYKGPKEPDIAINVNVAEVLPKIEKAKTVFVTYHFQSGMENWRFLRKGKTHIFKSPLEEKKHIMVVNRRFDRISAYLLSKKHKGRVWNTADIVYDFLQVLLINYFALRGRGIFIHSMGIKDVNGSGLIFAGKSGCGKSTNARLWYKYTRAMVLNDDRIIVCRNKNRFFIYSSPWHGDFSDYIASDMEVAATLKKIFFIHHAAKNVVMRISQKEAFSSLYPALFPTFWDRECLENIVSFCEDLVDTVDCYSLGFLNNRDIIDFVRKI